MTHRRLLLTLCAVSLMAACATQRSNKNIAYSNFEDGDYADTIEWIRRAESRGNVTPELDAELTYLEARSLERLGEYDQSKELYAYVADKHPDSKYGYLARGKLDAGIVKSDVTNPRK